MYLVHPFPERLHPIQNRPQLNPHLLLIILGQALRSLRHHLLGDGTEIGLQTNGQLLPLLSCFHQSSFGRFALRLRPNRRLPCRPTLRFSLRPSLLLLLRSSSRRLYLPRNLSHLARKVSVSPDSTGKKTHQPCYPNTPVHPKMVSPRHCGVNRLPLGSPAFISISCHEGWDNYRVT